MKASTGMPATGRKSFHACELAVGDLDPDRVVALVSLVVLRGRRRRFRSPSPFNSGVVRRLKAENPHDRLLAQMNLVDIGRLQPWLR